ncbi:MAG: hypothetical protein ACR2ML_03820 [Solirubrobacteraceae bacterium]
MSAFRGFPARSYLEKYYSYVGDENAEMLGAISAFARELRPAMGHVIEVGGGPSIVALLGLCSAVDETPGRITFVDVAESNLAEIELWRRNAKESFDYSAVTTWLERETGGRVADAAAALRAATWEPLCLDLLTPAPPDLIGTFDTVSSHFFAESATGDEEELLTLLHRTASFGRKNSTLFLSFMRRSDGYRLDQLDFPAVAVDEVTLPSILHRASVCLEPLLIRVAPVQDPPTRPGYEGMVFVAGRLRS